MHGRVKVKTTAEQQEAKQKERAKNLQLYLAGQQKAREKREKGELDAEARKVTEHLLLANPDLYTLWNFRKEILQDMKKKDKVKAQEIMEAELPFVESCLCANPKSYGAWHHRSWVMLEMPNPNWNSELLLCNKYLELDERNYILICPFEHMKVHCWDYRRFVVKQAAVGPEQELQFTDAKIAANFSNYSSWHYRSKLLPLVFPDAHKGVRPICEEKLLQEFELVQNAAFTDPNDQSAWFYHRWLLGRGDRGLQLNFMYANRDGDIILVFNKPVEWHYVRCSVTIVLDKCNNIELDMADWSLPRGCSGASHVVLVAAGHNFSSIFKRKGQVEVEAIYNRCSPILSLTLQLEECDFEGSIANPDRTKEFCMELSAATSTVIAREIDSCVQLQELEPDCKWPLLTTILLMRSLDYAKYSDKISEYFNTLIRVDPLRAGYYKNLRSKFIIENCLEGLEPRTFHFSLAGRGLDCLYHGEYFAHLKKLDLSSNNLSNLSGSSMSSLACLETFLLDDNQLRDCDGLANIPKLQELSIKNNNIRNVTSLKGLLKCYVLKSLAIRGNPLDDGSQRHIKLIADMFPYLGSLDNINLKFVPWTG